jgi:hypothetical protein
MGRTTYGIDGGGVAGVPLRELVHVQVAHRRDRRLHQPRCPDLHMHTDI